MDIHYDPKIWDSTGSIEFNVGLNYDNVDYTCQRSAKSSTSDTTSDKTAVSWLGGLFSSLYSKPMASSTAIAHGFIEDEDHERRFSFQSFQILHSADIPSLSLRNSVHLSTPSLRYTKRYCPEPEQADVDVSPTSTRIKRPRVHKIKLSPSPLLEKVRSKLKSQWKRKRTTSFYKIGEGPGPVDDVVLYPDEPDPDPFARQFGPYRISLD